MTTTTLVAFLAFAVIGFVLLLVLLLNGYQHGSGMLKFGPAEVQIRFGRGWEKAPVGGWGKAPADPERAKQNVVRRPKRYWLETKGGRWRFPLDDVQPVYVGRRDDSQIRLSDPTADTRQAVIYWEDGRYKINNLSSRNPTRVNGRSVTKQNLGDGNSIDIGRTRLIFRDRGSARRNSATARS